MFIKNVSMILVIFFTILCCFSNLGNNDKYEAKNDPKMISNEETEDLYLSVSLKPIISSPIVDIDTPVRVSFNETDVISHVYESEGLTVTQISEEAMEYDILATEGYGVLSVYATYEDNVTVKSSIYTYTDGNKVYLSEASKKNAFEKFLEQAILSDIYTLEEAEAIWSGFACENEIIDTEIVAPTTIDMSNEISECVLSGKGILCGNLYWEDDKGTAYPLRRVMVNIYTKVGGVNVYLSTAYTDNNGYFEKELIPCDNVFVRVYAGDGNVIVGSGIHKWWYAYTFDELYNVSAYSVTTVDLDPVPVSEDEGKAMQIAQAALTARDYAWIMMGEKPSMITIVYPSNQSTCCYDPQFNQMHIVNGISRDGKLTSYASWDVIMHEYGHHIQNEMDISDNWGGGHSIINMADHYKNHYVAGNFSKCSISSGCYLTDNPLFRFSENNCKYRGCTLAWAEAWATIFGMMAQKYYGVCIPILADEFYTAYNMSDRSISKSTVYSGDACEETIMAILWDVYDDDSSDDTHGISVSDNISLNHQAFWDLSTQSGTYTFNDFIENFYEEYPQHIYEIAPNLSKYKMAATIPSVSYSGVVSINNPIALSWNAQGGSIYYPNNRFSIIVYKNNWEMFRKENILTDSYTFSLSEWQDILSACGYKCGEKLEIAISIAAYQDDEASYTTGPYYSPLRSVTINHTCRYESLGETSHSYICNDCGSVETMLHNLIYTDCEASYHTKTCSDCGYYTTNEHTNWSCRRINDEIHEIYCIDCGYSYQGEHDFTAEYDYVNTDKHYAYCECGEFVEGDHFYQIYSDGELKFDACVYCGVQRNHEHEYTYTSCGDGKNHIKSCDCGFSQYQQCFGSATSGQITRCISCNQRLNGGLITPWSEEDEPLIIKK